MNIRKAQLEDVDALAGLFDQYRIFYQQPSDKQAAKEFLSERIQRNESVIFLAFLDGKMVGFTQLYPVFSSISMKRAWVLNDLYVVPETRGSGAADALLKAAQELGAETASGWLVLQTAHHNHRAQRVYERNRWEKDEAFFTYYYHY
jgi:ribosomal protein S18 acetylase RimI-like enzyme